MNVNIALLCTMSRATFSRAICREDIRNVFLSAIIAILITSREIEVQISDRYSVRKRVFRRIDHTGCL